MNSSAMFPAASDSASGPAPQYIVPLDFDTRWPSPSSASYLQSCEPPKKLSKPFRYEPNQTTLHAHERHGNHWPQITALIQGISLAATIGTEQEQPWRKGCDLVCLIQLS